MSTRVDQRFVFQMFILSKSNRVVIKDLAIDGARALRDDYPGVQKILADRIHIIMQHTISPKFIIVQMPVLQKLDDTCEKGFIFHSESDFQKIKRADIFSFKKIKHFLVRSLLGNIIPRRSIKFARLCKNIKFKGLGRCNILLILGDMHGEMFELTGHGEVKEIIDRLGAIRLQVDQDRIGELAVA